MNPFPRVALNFAITADGKITTRNRTPSDFSSPRDKARLLELRGTADAVLATVRTVATDAETLAVPSPPLPMRVMITNSGRIDPAMRIFKKTASRIVIFSTQKMPARTQRDLAPVATLHLAKSPNVDLRAMLHTLRRDYGVRRLMCEGGGILVHSLAAESLIDEINVTLCPVIFGGRAASTMTGPAGDFLPAAQRWRRIAFETIGSECFLRYRAVRP